MDTVAVSVALIWAAGSAAAAALVASAVDLPALAVAVSDAGSMAITVMAVTGRATLMVMIGAARLTARVGRTSATDSAPMFLLTSRPNRCARTMEKAETSVLFEQPRSVSRPVMEKVG